MKSDLENDKELEELDDWIKSLPIRKVGEDFTATVMTSALLMQKRNKSMRYVVGALVFFLGLGVCGFVLTPSLDNQPLQTWPSSVLDWRGYLFDSSTLQVFLMIEAVLSLIIIDKLFFYYKLIKARHAQSLHS